MTPHWKKLGYLTLLALLGVYAYLMITGSRGLPALQERRQRINTLQQQNAELAAENARRRERIRQLTEDRETQELEVLRRLNKKRRGTQPFFLGERSDQTAPPSE